MATLAITMTTTQGNAGATLRALAQRIEQASSVLTDTNPTGASVTLTIDNAPATGVASIVVAGGGLGTQPTYIVG